MGATRVYGTLVFQATPQTTVRKSVFLYADGMRSLSPKQTRFLSIFLKEGKTQTEAALNAYNLKNRKSAAVQGSRLMRNEKIKDQVHSFLKKGSLDEYDIALALKAGLKAKKIFRTPEGHLKVSDYNDYSIQAKYLKLALKVLHI